MVMGWVQRKQAFVGTGSVGSMSDLAVIDLLLVVLVREESGIIGERKII